MIETLPILQILKEPLLNLAKNTKDEILHLAKNELKNHLISSAKKYGKTKTFLYRYERIEFYKAYYPIKVRDSEKNIDLDNINNLFKESQYCSIIGSAGSGKSMLTKHFFLNTLKNKDAIPLIIELRNLNKFNGTIIEYIYSLLLNIKVGPTISILERMLKSGKFIFLLDGYDEIYHNKVDIITDQINKFIDLYHNNKFVITSRPGSNSELLPRFNNFSVNSLTKKESKDFITKQLKIRWKDNSQELINNLSNVIDDKKYKDVSTYLKNPLLLSMFMLTYEVKSNIPQKRSDFYANVFDVLCLEHNALSKPGYQHEKQSDLSNSDIEKILEFFSFSTYIKGVYSFDYSSLKSELNIISNKKYKNISFQSEKLINDITVSIPILLKEGLEYKYIHRSLQEYFSCLFIKNLDDKFKEKIYSKSLTEISLKSNDSFFNFWNLCIEIDKNSFITYFLIPTLEKFLSKIDFTSESFIVESFFKLIDIQLLIEFHKTETDVYDGPYEFSPNRYGPSADVESGVVYKCDWDDDFKLFRKVLNFLNILNTNEFTESIKIPELIPYVDFEWREKINNHETVLEILDDLSWEYEEIKELVDLEELDASAIAKFDREFYESIYFNTSNTSNLHSKFIERFGYYSDEKIFIQQLDLNHRIEEIYDYSVDSKLDILVLKLIQSVKNKIYDLKQDVKNTDNFNNDLLDEILS